MEDIRVSIRLTPNQHKALKHITINKNTTIQKLLLDYIIKIIQEENFNEKD